MEWKYSQMLNMASGFTKYISIIEREYQKFREEQQKQAILTQEELARPSVILPLANAQNEKTLFAPSKNPDLQEQRYKQLFNIIQEL